MPRFFTDNISGGFGTVTGEDARHIALSLRMKVGEEIVLCRGGVDFVCTLEEISPESVTCKVLEEKPCAAEPDVKLHLIQAVPKGEKAEIIVQKAVELGVFDITFVLTSRCISRPDEKSFSKKLNRYNKIALEAAKQSGRGIIPKVYGLITLSQAVDMLKGYDSAVWCYEKGGASFSSLGLSPNSEIGLLIGSEGGFSDEEAAVLKQSGISPVSMGRRILRCETAPLAAASIIMNLTGNM
ncbi:MAG: RsmE family RNA methyltransferase [Oscillospiraceae bacterium]